MRAARACFRSSFFAHHHMAAHDVVRSTATALHANLQVARLSDGLLPIPDSLPRVVIEIGASDRDTLDSWLEKGTSYGPAWNDTFLVTLEPLVDKYARGLARSKEFSGDAFQPLGFHHPRGLILPFAVGPSDQPARVVTFNVGKNAGCSSLLQTVHGRLGWCKTVSERRDVPLVTLERILGLIGSHRAVDFVKIDGTEQRSYTPVYPSGVHHHQSLPVSMPNPSLCRLDSLVSLLSKRKAWTSPPSRAQARCSRACVRSRSRSIQTTARQCTRGSRDARKYSGGPACSGTCLRRPSRRALLPST